MTEPKALIFSKRWRKWWNPDAAGYTSLIERAGIYTAAEAQAQIGLGETSRVVLPEEAAPILHDRLDCLMSATFAAASMLATLNEGAEAPPAAAGAQERPTPGAEAAKWLRGPVARSAAVYALGTSPDVSDTTFGELADAILNQLAYLIEHRPHG